MSSPHMLICRACGSDNLSFDTFAEWDVVIQTFVISDFANNYPMCADCGEESEPKTVPVVDERQFCSKCGSDQVARLIEGFRQINYDGFLSAPFEYYEGSCVCPTCKQDCDAVTANELIENKPQGGHTR